MKIITERLRESILCTLPNGDQIEITMLCAEGEDCYAEPEAHGAVDLLLTYLNGPPI